MRCKQVNYGKLYYKFENHLNRYKKYVAEHGLTCQDCCGEGGHYEYPGGLELGGMFVGCGWCKGTGKVTRWTRGAWLRYKKQEKQELAKIKLIKRNPNVQKSSETKTV